MSRTNLKLIVLVGAILVVGIAAYFLPIGRWATDLVAAVRDLGAAGVAVYAGVYVVAAVLFVPGSVLTIGAGFLYGLWGGVALVVPSAVLAATIAFVIGRHLARDLVARKVEGYPRLRAVDAAIGEGGFGIIALLRLSPLFPFTLLNYFLGLTGARLRDYVAASALGMIPGTFLYVYIGSLIENAAAIASGERPDTGIYGNILLGVGLVATAAVTVLISRLAKRRLAEKTSIDDPPPAEAGE